MSPRLLCGHCHMSPRRCLRTMEELLRALLLGLARSETANGWMKRYGLRLGADRFVAGETIDEALDKVRQLEQSQLLSTLDHLGEFVRDTGEASAAKDHCIAALDAIAAAGLKATLSVKLTQLGLDIAPDLCAANVRSILDRARKQGNFIQIDMEDFRHCQATVDLLLDLSDDYDNVGGVMQAYLYRSAEDTAELARRGVPLRIVKGAYKESRNVAYPEKSDVDARFRELVEISLRARNYTAIATHDEHLVNWTRSFVHRNGVVSDSYEFQMLYGIRPALQQDLARAGYRVRLYVPYGTDWYGYFMRRLAERPANAAFVLRSLYRR